MAIHATSPDKERSPQGPVRFFLDGFARRVECCTRAEEVRGDEVLSDDAEDVQGKPKVLSGRLSCKGKSQAP